MRIATMALILCVTLAATSQEHQSRFELSEEFVRAWAADPVRRLEVKLACAGPVHVGAQLNDPGISDFQDVVIEPPNVCKNKSHPWRARINALANSDCTATGFIRAWPEHLSNGQGCSNPPHFMEVHPALKIRVRYGEI
jgi:hypothetical protein